jgi:hypothetical protein
MIVDDLDLLNTDNVNATTTHSEPRGVAPERE